MMNLSNLSDPQYSAVAGGRKRRYNPTDVVLSRLPAHIATGQATAADEFSRKRLAQEQVQYDQRMTMEKDIANKARNQAFAGTLIQGAGVAAQGAKITKDLGWWGGGGKAPSGLASVKTGTPAMAYTPEGLSAGGTSLAGVTARPEWAYTAAPGEGVSLAGASAGTAGATEGAAAAAEGTAAGGTSVGSLGVGLAKGAGVAAIGAVEPYVTKWAGEQLGTSFEPVVKIGARMGQGALIGSMVPGVGTLVGTVVGGVIGAVESIFGK